MEESRVKCPNFPARRSGDPSGRKSRLPLDGAGRHRALDIDGRLLAPRDVLPGEGSTFFETNSRDVKSVTLNLKTLEGLAILHKFAANFAAAVAIAAIVIRWI